MTALACARVSFRSPQKEPSSAPAVFFMPLMIPLAYTCATAPRYASGIYAQSGILRAAPFVTASVSPRTLARKFRIITAIS